MIRESRKEDTRGISRLLASAFSPSRYESRLRQAVVERDRPHYEWVVENESTVVAHILYTLAMKGEEVVGLHLAPVAVHPDFQKQGIGSSLIRETLQATPISAESVFVLGDPEFYERFGFVRTASALCPFDEENKHFRALRWSKRSEVFVIGYDEAFQLAERGETD